MTPKNPWLAVNLSMFFPGIGQVYAGESFRGLGFALSGLVLIAIASWSVFSSTGNTVKGLSCLLLFAIIYVLNLYDAFACTNKQLSVRTSEKIPRTQKDPWFAVFLSRILPGLGHLYIGKAIMGALLLSSIIIFSGFANLFQDLLIFTPIISSVACYHAFVASPRQRRQQQYLIAIICLFVFAFGLIGNYLPNWIKQEIEIFEIPSRSMLPTLQVGDRVFVSKFSGYLPQRGDVMVFVAPEAARRLESEGDKDEERYYIKRVIGEPGQAVRIANGTVYINDQPVPEPYIAEPPAYEWGPESVPAESYFVMGDNRNNSFDSHVWGFLPKRYIVGQAYKVFWPPERIQSLINSDD